MTAHRKNTAEPEEKDAALSDDCENRIAKFWKTADDTQPERMLEAMNVLRQELPVPHHDALFEWASVHDFLGRESQAVPLYEQAHNNGVAGRAGCREAFNLPGRLAKLGEARAPGKRPENSGSGKE